jgi:hypothetical protein
VTVDVGAWLAEQLGLPAAQIEVVGHPLPVFRGDQIVTYTQGGQFVARVILGVPKAQGWLPFHQRRPRSLRATWPGGSASLLISADEDVVW